jgi:hypothetical protein
MLLYHPFFDPEHCVFRMLRLLDRVGPVEIELPRFRVWDFYLLFPTALQNTRLPRTASRIRSLVRGMENRYEVLPDPRRAFIRLEPMQNAALAHLSAIGVISPERLVEAAVLRTDLPIPEVLASLIHQRNAENDAIMEFLTTEFLTLPLYGRSGIRVRTELFDHRYDIS